MNLDDILEAARYIERAKNSAKGGPPRRTHCQNGHDLAVHGRQQYVVNKHGVKVKAGRYCETCKRDKQRNGEPRPNARKPRAPGRNPYADDYVPAERSHHRKETS